MTQVERNKTNDEKNYFSHTKQKDVHLSNVVEMNEVEILYNYVNYKEPNLIKDFPKRIDVYTCTA